MPEHFPGLTMKHQLFTSYFTKFILSPPAITTQTSAHLNPSNPTQPAPQHQPHWQVARPLNSRENAFFSDLGTLGPSTDTSLEPNVCCRNHTNPPIFPAVPNSYRISCRWPDKERETLTSVNSSSAAFGGVTLWALVPEENGKSLVVGW